MKQNNIPADNKNVLEGGAQIETVIYYFKMSSKILRK